MEDNSQPVNKEDTTTISNQPVQSASTPITLFTFFENIFKQMATIKTLCLNHSKPDTNTYIIALNNSSNAWSISFLVLFLVILYIIIMYLCSFIYVPIQTITNESQMFSSLLFNPTSPITLFNDFVKSKMENFSNISENYAILDYIKHKIEYIYKSMQYWFHRSLLYFYIHKGTITSTRQI